MKFANFLRTVSVATSDVQLVFSKESRTKAGATVRIKTIFSRKNVFAVTKIQKQAP